MSPLIIGIGGKAQTGKGFAARIIRNHIRARGSIAMPLAYAWPLKARVATLRGYTSEEVLSKPSYVRTAFQIEGTENGRNLYGPDFWVQQLECMVALIMDEEPQCAAITIVDARFPNELEYIKANHGFTIYLESNRGCLVGEHSQHASETSVDNSMFDYVVVNNTDTSELKLRYDLEHILNTEVYGEYNYN